MKKSICIFCSSSDKAPETYFKLARRLGREIAAAGYRLVYGGAKIGLMGAVAEAVSETGGDLLGVIPKKLHEHAIANEQNGKLIITADMRERKAVMEQESDAFIAMPGGFGTLEEFVEILTLRQLKYHTKPLVLLNHNGFFDHLTAHFEQLFNQFFAKEAYRDLYYTAENTFQALNYIQNFQETEIADKWF